MRVAYVCADRGVPVFGNKGSSVHVRAVIEAGRVEVARDDGHRPLLEAQRPNLVAITWQRLTRRCSSGP